MRRYIPALLGLTVAIGLGATAALAQPKEFRLDRSHSYIGFEINHFGFSRTVGRFNDYSGKILIDEADPARSAVEVDVKTASIDTNHEARDGHLRSADFFNVDQFPSMIFKSTGIQMTGDREGKVTGNLTLLGVTKPVTLDFFWTKDGTVPIPAYKNVRTIGFMATGQIKRSEFGMDTFVGEPIGDEVDLKINFDAVHCVGEAAQAPSCTY